MASTGGGPNQNLTAIALVIGNSAALITAVTAGVFKLLGWLEKRKMARERKERADRARRNREAASTIPPDPEPGDGDGEDPDADPADGDDDE